MADKMTEPPMIAMIRRRQLLMGVAAGALVGGMIPSLAFGQTAATEIAPATRSTSPGSVAVPEAGQPAESPAIRIRKATS